MPKIKMLILDGLLSSQTHHTSMARPCYPESGRRPIIILFRLQRQRLQDPALGVHLLGTFGPRGTEDHIIVNH